MPDRLPTLLEEHHGFMPNVMLLRSERLEEAVADNPLPEAVGVDTTARNWRTVEKLRQMATS